MVESRGGCDFWDICLIGVLFVVAAMGDLRSDRQSHQAILQSQKKPRYPTVRPTTQPVTTFPTIDNRKVVCDGTWENANMDKLLDSDFCQAQSADFTCKTNDDTSTSEWISNCGKFSNEEFFFKFNGRTIFFVGDSAVSNVWENLVCRLAPNGGILETNIDKTAETIRCHGYRCEHGSSGSAVFRDHNIVFSFDILHNDWYYKCR